MTVFNRGTPIYAFSPSFRSSQFWRTQPVPQTLSDSLSAPSTTATSTTISTQSASSSSISAHIEIEEGPIDKPKTVGDVKKESLALPKGYEWVTVDVMDQAQVSVSSNFDFRLRSAGARTEPSLMNV